MVQLCLGRHRCQSKDPMRKLGLYFPAGRGDAQAWSPMGQELFLIGNRACYVEACHAEHDDDAYDS